MNQILTEIKFFFQKTFRGYSDKELYSLDLTIIDFILPRLQRFKKMERTGHPSGLKNMKTWEAILDKIIHAFIYAKNVYGDIDYDIDYDIDDDLREKKYDEFCEGMRLFAEYFGSLWD